MPHDAPSAAPPKRRRRFQFSLRTMMVFTAICAVGCGWLFRRVEQKRKEREAVEALRRNFVAECFYDYQLDGSGAEPPGPGWLRSVFGENFFAAVTIANFGGMRSARESSLVRIEAMPDLVELNMPLCDLSDQGLVHLQGLTKLRELNLSGTNVGDGIVCLSKLRDLRELHLHGTQVGDVGAAGLAALVNLEDLDLGYTRVTDAGLKNLAGLTQLRKLTLTDTSAGDEGMEAIARLENLRTLDLNGTRIGNAGVAKLQTLTELRELDLTDCAVSDAGLTWLAKLPNLEKLDISGTRITAHSLYTLMSMHQLKSLSIHETLIVPAIDQLRRALPDCKID
jgi:hypothetical protein